MRNADAAKTAFKLRHERNQILEFTDMVLTRQHMLIANGYVQLTVGEIAKIYKDLL